MTESIIIETSDDRRLAIVKINRPQRRNACDFEAWTRLRDIFRELAHEKALRLAILTGEGGHFCAGDDIIAFRAAMNDPEEAETYRARIQECYAAVQDLPVPVIAALSGVCVGGGCSLALCCDFRVGDASAKVGVPVAKLGIVYPTIQLIRLSHLIGISETRRWLYTGDMVDAEQARQAGFLDLLTTGDVLKAAQEFGAGMMDSAPLSIAGSKMQLNAIAANRLQEREAQIAELSDKANNSEDYKNAAAAFSRKRKPTFQGR